MRPDWSTVVSAIGKWLLKYWICGVFLRNVTVGLLHISTSFERTEFFLIADAFSASFRCKLARCLVILVQVVFFFHFNGGNKMVIYLQLVIVTTAALALRANCLFCNFIRIRKQLPSRIFVVISVGT